MGLTFMMNTLLGKTSECNWKTQFGDLGEKNYPYTLTTVIIYFMDLLAPPHKEREREREREVKCMENLVDFKGF
jgi:hypothetical protein